MPLITVGTENDTPIESRSSPRTTAQEDRDLPEDTTRPPRAGAGDITESLTIAVDAGTESTRIALDRLDLTGPSTRALLALDVRDRIALLPTRLDSLAIGPRGPDELAPAATRAVQLELGLIWRIDGASSGARAAPGEFDAFRRPGHVKVRWTLDATSSESGSWLTIRTRFTPTDEAAAERLRDAWGVLGALSRVLAERAARAVSDYAEALEDEPAALEDELAA
jgi:hypothetical protein